MKIVIISVYCCTVTELDLNENVIFAKIADKFRITVQQWLAVPAIFFKFFYNSSIVSSLILDTS